MKLPVTTATLGVGVVLFVQPQPTKAQAPKFFDFDGPAKLLRKLRGIDERLLANAAAQADWRLA
jgi:hypothetical protein